MGSTVKMSSYKVDLAETITDEYGDEVLCSGWNPAVALACQQYLAPRSELPISIPASLALVDAEVFLQRMYAYQR
jgi:hypothetical protein